MKWSFIASLVLSLGLFLGSIGFSAYRSASSSNLSYGGSSTYVTSQEPAQVEPDRGQVVAEPETVVVEPPNSTSVTEATTNNGQKAFPAEDQGESNETGDRRLYAADGDKFGFELQRVDEMGLQFWVPAGWTREDVPIDEGYKSVRYNGPDHSAFVRMDVAPAFRESWPIENFQKLESAFQQSDLYEYERERLRTGSDAYYGGVIWNYLLKRKGGPWMKRTAVYFNHKGQNWALGTGFEKDAPLGFGRQSTAMFDGLYTLPE